MSRWVSLFVMAVLAAGCGSRDPLVGGTTTVSSPVDPTAIVATSTTVTDTARSTSTSVAFSGEGLRGSDVVSDLPIELIVLLDGTMLLTTEDSHPCLISSVFAGDVLPRSESWCGGHPEELAYPWDDGTGGAVVSDGTEDAYLVPAGYVTGAERISLSSDGARFWLFHTATVDDVHTAVTVRSDKSHPGDPWEVALVDIETGGSRTLFTIEGEPWVLGELSLGGERLLASLIHEDFDENGELLTQDSELRLYTLQGKRVDEELPPEVNRKVGGLAENGWLSPNGNRLAYSVTYATGLSEVVVVDLTTTQKLGTFEVASGPETRVTRVLFDGHRVFVSREVGFDYGYVPQPPLIIDTTSGKVTELTEDQAVLTATFLLSVP